jgi:anti-sigma factor RsiW
MTCVRSRDVDLSEALRERGSLRFAAFHAHHPTCPECRATLAPWLRLDAWVRAAAAAPLQAHPSDESLAALLEPPGRFSRAERRRVLRHIEGCGPCRDALLAVAALEDA